MELNVLYVYLLAVYHYQQYIDNQQVSSEKDFWSVIYSHKEWYLKKQRLSFDVSFCSSLLLRLFNWDFFPGICHLIFGCGVPRAEHVRMICSFSWSISLLFESIVISIIFGGAKIQSHLSIKTLYSRCFNSSINETSEKKEGVIVIT
jgi:hypothetical protein